MGNGMMWNIYVLDAVVSLPGSYALIWSYKYIKIYILGPKR